MASPRSFVRRPRHLSISSFSAFDDVTLELGALTIITGPQASGKSLICKLTYFFQEIFADMLSAVQDGQTYEQFTKTQASQFTEWFPASAWGQAKFHIRYSVDSFTIDVTRAGGRGSLKSSALVRHSDSLRELYSELAEGFEASKLKAPREDQLAYIISAQNYRFRSDFYKSVSATFGSSATASQTYVPASRAFFTTVGRAMSAFEHGQLIDPITKSFGRLYIGLTERFRQGVPLGYRFSGARGASGGRYRNSTMAEIFGGTLKLERNEMIIEAPDGRLIPLYALSSGQQELLPLWLTLDYFDSTIHYQDLSKGANFLYIEEPEAHLFPEAQAGVLSVLASLLSKPEAQSQMVLTTHSPYLLSKANNLLLAGRLGFRKRLDRQKKIDSIVPRSRWLLPNDVTCYGLETGKAIDLIGADGLISTDYIDNVSQDIVDEHQRLYDAAG